MTVRYESDAGTRRQLMSVARKYRRDGYSVTIPDRTTELPSFLGDHVPDLIAISKDDRVIVEVKRAESLRGSNELVDLAERVQRDPRWRLELIALASPPAAPMSSEALDETRKDVEALVDARFYDAAFIQAFAATEALIGSIATANKIDPVTLSFPRLIRALVTRALISTDQYDAINRAVASRNRLIHEGKRIGTDRFEVDDVLALNDALLAETHAEEAA